MNRLSRRLLLSVSLAAAGCSIPIDLERSIPLQVRAIDTACATLTKTLDVSEDATFRKYQDKISGIELVSLSVRILDAKALSDSRATLLSGTVKVAPSESSPAFLLSTLTDVPVQDGHTEELVYDVATAGQASQWLLVSRKITLFAEGCANELPAAFDAELVLGLTATAQVGGE